MIHIINKFRGEYNFLSNFYISPVKFNGITFFNSEAAYQSAKCKDKDQMIQFRGLSGKEAKYMGRKVEIRADWDKIKFQLMSDIVKDKFKRNAYLRKKLKDTGNEVIQETNYWHDNIWGVCECRKCKDILGENNLGKILMEIREELR